MHVGSRESAEEIIGNVVVECYDYDEVRFSLFNSWFDNGDFRAKRVEI